ncbi:putative pterin-4-alpha-carbinolamine dehydratase [Nakaseomyces bracarensis]|uniref:4a-hydroxytetrahydrobiopterin dehydratase n=1 Tax=Nakaseomyces bracarensis TaxID=273131 RepID=A0ABR4NMZ0_9SACH
MFNRIVKAEAERVSLPELQKLLQGQLAHWTQRDDRLIREVKFNDYQATWAFLTQVSMRAHLWGHHPTITTTYTSVKLELQTHDLLRDNVPAPGVSNIDIKLAKQIEKYITKT